MNVVLAVGSVRPPRSNTESIAAFLRIAIESTGAGVTSIEAQAWKDSDPELPADAAEALRTCDVLVVVTPVYLDTLPAPALRMLERLRDALSSRPPERPVACYAVAHSGYLEPAHKGPALETCGHFARAAGLDWRGGLGFGGTSPIAGRPLEALGWMTKNLRRCLGQLAETIARAEPISPRLEKRAGKSPIPLPLWMIVPLLNRMTRRDFERRRQVEPLARPFER